MSDVTTQVAIGEGRVVAMHGRFSEDVARQKAVDYLTSELGRIERALDRVVSWQITCWKGNERLSVPGRSLRSVDPGEGLASSS